MVPKCLVQALDLVETEEKVLWHCLVDPVQMWSLDFLGVRYLMLVVWMWALLLEFTEEMKVTFYVNNNIL